MSSWRDEIEQSVHTVITEAGVTLDTRLFSKNVIVLAFKISNDLLESVPNISYMAFTKASNHIRELVVDIVPESGGVDDS